MAQTLADLARALRDLNRANRMGTPIETSTLRLAIGVLVHRIEDRIEADALADKEPSR